MKKILIVSLLATPLVFGANTSYAKRTLKVWYLQTELKPIIVNTIKKMPNVDIKLRYVPTTEMEQEYLKAVASRHGIPDIIQLDNPQCAYYIHKGLLKNITAEVKNSSIINGKDYYKGSWQTVIDKNNNVFGIPWTIDALALFYNTDMFKSAGLDPNKPPKTWEEMYQYAKKLTDKSKGQYGIHMSFPSASSATYQFLPWVQMTGSNWDNFNTKGTLEAFKYIKRFYTEKLISPASLSQGQAPSFLVSRHTAMQIIGPWALTLLKTDKSLHYKVAPMPINPKYNINASALGGINTVIASKATNPQDAFKFLETFVKNSHNMWNDAGVINANRTINEKIIPKSGAKVFETFKYQLKFAKPRGPNPNWVKINTVIYKGVQKVLTNKETPEKEIVKMSRQIKRYNK